MSALAESEARAAAEATRQNREREIHETRALSAALASRVSTPPSGPSLARVLEAIAAQREWFTEASDDVLSRIKTDTTEDVMLYHDAVSVLVAARGVYDLIAGLAVSTPPSEDEREELAMTVKQVTQKFGGPSMAEFADTPPIRKHYATADAILAKGFRRPAAIASDAFRDFVDHLGVDANEEHDGNEWWSGYRQAQRDNIRRANDALNASAAALPEGVRPLAYAVDDLEDGADFQDAISSESIRLVVRYMRARLPVPAVPAPTEPEED